MYLKIFDNYHAGISMLPNEEQDAFYGALARYAFDGEEPELHGISQAVWATIKDFVDKSLAGQENGSKGGNGRGNKTLPKTPSENPLKNPCGKPPAETPCENQKKRKEGNRRENLEGFSSIPPDSVGADARSAPPESVACPTCGVEMEPTNSFSPNKRRRIYRCPLCADTAEVGEVVA